MPAQSWLESAQFILLSGGRATEVGARRSVVFAPDKWLHEDLLSLDDVSRSITYCGVNYAEGSAERPLSASPFPGSFVDYKSTVQIWPVTVREPGAPPAAFMRWSGHVWTEPSAAQAMAGFLTGFYDGNIRKLQAKFSGGV